MNKARLDVALLQRHLVLTRSQGENLIRLGKVKVGGRVVTKPGEMIHQEAQIELAQMQQYVSRAGLKLASVAELLGLDFREATVLDVGSSTGGFSDYALQHGAGKVIAVDVGTDQLHPSLRSDNRVEVHEKTDIRDFQLEKDQELPTIIVIDISFMSLRLVLPHLAKTLCDKGTMVAAMVKPQFEAGKTHVNKGVIKNEAVRRRILKDFEAWVRQYFFIVNKKDSEVTGAKGNRERFYILKLSKSLT